MKPHLQRDNLSTKGSDDMQSPPEAIAPLIPYLQTAGIQRIWEPAFGKGNLVGALKQENFHVSYSDITTGFDFRTFEPCFPVDCIITNPPYSLKDEFLARCYELGYPFALLLPLTALEGQKRQALYKQHGVEVILLDRRLHFETPSGKQSGSWFATCWITHGLNIGQQLTFAVLPKLVKVSKKAKDVD